MDLEKGPIGQVVRQSAMQAALVDSGNGLDRSREPLRYSDLKICRKAKASERVLARFFCEKP